MLPLDGYIQQLTAADVSIRREQKTIISVNSAPG
jgi:hypothetical protein